MATALRIRGKPLGAGAPTFVIGEAGSNHNRDLAMAHALIDAAAAAGADAVKFQTFEARRLYPKSAGTSDYLGVATPIFELMRSLEMPAEWLPELRAHAHRMGLAFLSTPFDEAAVALLDPHVDAFKVASYELTHEPLLRAVAARGKPVLLSTGAADLDEVRRAVDVLRAAGAQDLVVLQCTAAYPTPPDAANVRALVALREALGVEVGLSDHTRDPITAPMAAVALGAAVLEKHFTLDNRLPGPDHAFAVEPAELVAMVRAIRGVERVLGSGRKEVQPVERELRAFARRSLFTTTAVRQGERLSRANVDVLRCGKRGQGLAPAALDRVLASVAARDLAAETAVTDADLVPALGPAPLALRPAGSGDCARTFAWADDAQTRAGSFHSARFSFAEHSAWFEGSLRGGQRVLRIAEVAGEPVGLIRFDRIAAEPSAAEIGITVAPSHRGRGLACELLRAAHADAAALGIQALWARIRVDNERSRRVFERAGYAPAGRERVAGVEAARYRHELAERPPA